MNSCKTIFMGIVFLLGYILVSAGCSTATINPVEPNPADRNGATVFEPTMTILGSQNLPAFCVDLATVVQGCGFTGGFGNPIAINDFYWTAAVAQQLESGWQTINDPTVLAFRWLYREQVPGQSGQIHYNYECNIDPGVGYDFRTPHVDTVAYYKANPYTFYVEVAICYRYIDPEDGDLDIGVYRMRFNHTALDPVNGFDPPNWTDNYPVPDPLDGFSNEIPCNDFFPDIAYDPYTSDMYLVWTRQMDDGNHPIPGDFRVHYMRFDRNPSSMDGNWLGPWLAHPQNHNGWTPRIDVGTTGDLFTVPAGNNVVLAYTSQFANDHLGFHLRANAWATGDDEDHINWDLDLEDPQFPNRDAGLPCVDISPELNVTRYVAISYIQNRGDVTGEPIWGASLWNTESGLHRIVGGSSFQKLYPTIAINYEEGPGSPRNISISYFIGDGLMAWRPCALLYHVDTQLEGNFWLIDGTASGYWDFSQLVRYYWGTNCALTVLPEQRYWLAWSDCAGAGGWPVEVKGTNGFLE